MTPDRIVRCDVKISTHESTPSRLEAPPEHPIFDLMREVEACRTDLPRQPRRWSRPSFRHRLWRRWQRLTDLCMGELEL
jgi:hypothetical protein